MYTGRHVVRGAGRGSSLVGSDSGWVFDVLDMQLVTRAFEIWTLVSMTVFGTRYSDQIDTTDVHYRIPRILCQSGMFFRDFVEV